MKRTRSVSGIWCVWMIVVILIFSSGGIGAAELEKPQYGGTLIYSVGGEPPSFDGHRESTYALIHPVSPHYSLLLKFDQNDYPKIIGDLAERTVSPQTIRPTPLKFTRE